MLGLLEEPPQAATATAHVSPIAAACIRDLVIAQFYAAADNTGVARYAGPYGLARAIPCAAAAAPLVAGSRLWRWRRPHGRVMGTSSFDRRSAFSGAAYSWLLPSRGPPAGARRRSRLLLLGGDGYGGGPVGSCTPQALAACRNAGDWISVPLPMLGKYSPRPRVNPCP